MFWPGGTATIHKHGKTVQVTDPRIVSKAEAAPLVTSARVLYRVHPYDEAALVVTARYSVLVMPNTSAAGNPAKTSGEASSFEPRMPLPMITRC